MKNKKIIDAWDEIVLSEDTENRIFDKIQQKLQPPKFKLKTVLITAALIIVFATAAVASAPLIFDLFIPAKITQNSVNYIEGTEHNIIINSVSISPDGNNLMVITEKAGSNPFKELFADYFIVDDKGNFYGQVTNGYLHAYTEWNEDKTFTVDFYGNVPSDAQYLKLIPYNSYPIPEVVLSDSGEPKYIGDPKDEEYYRSLLDPREFYLESKYDISTLPQVFKQSEYGNLLIESCIVTDEDITVTYRYEGMVRASHILPTDEKQSISPNGELSHRLPVYNCDTDSYTLTFTFNKPIPNVKDVVKGLWVQQYDIKLLEDQAITIPLQK